MWTCIYSSKLHGRRWCPRKSKSLPKRKEQSKDRFSRWIWSIRWSFTKPAMDIHSPRKKENRERMDLGLPRNTGGGAGAEAERNQTCLDAARQEKLRRPLQKFAVLPQAWHETQAGTQYAGIRPRVLDEALHSDEHKITEEGHKRIRKEFLQTHEKLRVRENDGERKEAHWHQNRLQRWEKKIANWLRVRLLRGAHIFATTSPACLQHAQGKCKAGQALVCWYDDSGQQQDPDVWFVSTTRSKSSTTRGVNSSTQTQTASCWRYKTTMSTRTWKTESICTTQAITPMITCFIATYTKKCFGQDERQDSGSANHRVCLPSAKNLLNPGREAKHQKIERQEKVRFAERNRASYYKKALFCKIKHSGTKWTCFAARGMRFMGCGWTG